MIYVYTASFLLLGAAALTTLARITKGPGVLDRVVAFDVLTASLIGMLTMIAVVTGRWDLVPVIVALSLVGFVGSVAVARFMSTEKPESTRTLPKSTLAGILAALPFAAGREGRDDS